MVCTITCDTIPLLYGVLSYIFHISDGAGESISRKIGSVYTAAVTHFKEAQVSTVHNGAES